MIYLAACAIVFWFVAMPILRLLVCVFCAIGIGILDLVSIARFNKTLRKASGEKSRTPMIAGLATIAVLGAYLCVQVSARQEHQRCLREVEQIRQTTAKLISDERWDKMLNGCD